MCIHANTYIHEENFKSMAFKAGVTEERHLQVTWIYVCIHMYSLCMYRHENTYIHKENLKGMAFKAGVTEERHLQVTWMYVCIHMYSLRMYIHANTYIHEENSERMAFKAGVTEREASASDMDVCVHAYIHAYIHTYTHVHIATRIVTLCRLHRQQYMVRMYMYIRLCIHTCAYISIQR
jgi:hypothetical protein